MTPRRRRPHPALGLFAAALTLVLAGCRPEDARRSVLLVTLDTLRADHLGAYGHPEPVSPRFDALAARGVLYERAVAASSRTAPAHATIMTSRYVRDHTVGHRNGATQLEAEHTLARTFRDAGFRTAAFVSNTMLRRRIGLHDGFEVFDDELPDRELTRFVYERHADKTAERALAWLESVDAPWFLWVHYNDPHGPYTPPEAYRQFAGAAVGTVQRDDTPLEPLDRQRGFRGLPAYQVLGKLRRPSEYRALYAGEVRYADEALGRLVESAERAAGSGGLVLLVTADHGESFGEEGFWLSHGYATTPDLCHVPFLLVAPGLRPGRSPELVHHVDVMPTLLELVGLDAPPSSAGLPLGRHWRTGETLPERVVFADVGTEVSAYQADRFERIRIEGDVGDTPEGSRQSYRWSPDGWTAIDDDPAQGPARARLDAYVAREAPLSFAPKVNDADRERLRALGYLKPKGEEPAEDAR